MVSLGSGTSSRLDCSRTLFAAHRIVSGYPLANLEPYKHSRLGIYLAGYMTSATQAGRFAGDLVTVVAARYHSVVGILAALAIIFIAWAYGLNLLLPR